jgi:hypothetical protein
MELLRNLGSAAASSLLQKSGITLPFSLGERVNSYNGKSIWTLHDAIKKVKYPLVARHICLRVSAGRQLAGLGLRI